MRRLVLVTALLSLAPPAWAGPPFVTDDPDPGALHQHELDLGVAYSKTSAAHGGDELGLLPTFEVDYTAFEETQLHLLAIGEYDRARQAGEANFGYGDTELGIKRRFIRETDHWPQVSTAPLLEIPTGNHARGLGNGRLQLFVPILLQKSLGQWTTYGGGGFLYNPSRDARSYWRAGIVIQRELSTRLALGVEFYHETPTAPGVGGHTAANAGGAFNFTEHCHLLFSAGRDIDGPRQLMTYLGLQFDW